MLAAAAAAVPSPPGRCAASRKGSDCTKSARQREGEPGPCQVHPSSSQVRLKPTGSVESTASEAHLESQKATPIPDRSCDAGGRGMPSTIAGAVTETTARGKQEGGPTASAVSPVRAAPPATAAAAPPGPSRLPVVTCTPGEDSEDVAARRGDASREPAPLPDGTSGNARPEANSDPYAYMGSEATPAAAKRTSRICSARTAAAKAPSKSTPGAIPRTPPTRAAEGAGGSGTRDDEDGAPTVRRGSMRNLKWTCGVCTMENEPAKRKCAVCKAPRGADTVPEVRGAEDGGDGGGLGQHVLLGAPNGAQETTGMPKTSVQRACSRRVA